ncbi:large conductance mechanosensitive channel protein MscL [Microvirga sp. STR05]|uniref:Large-conductance mechanosensitive channel n=2 Tax=Hymenobacter TaxID=89966 RepID=A0A7G7W637_9BACT|nr:MULTISPECIES: large conductance mechanosensitive channel protein MscL [Hymenobacter]MBD2713931.1 large conductance mechanosensitive channel protein MscL [Hymenobacter duratus]MBR7948833.1 large conductance mechanosensitive channel protein MscL [Microvirga sp. STR05]QNH61830.1 large conductance mechanosensitive channel protein MscL [Hymenobacter sediminicola]
MGFVSEFKEFISKGNVLDLAVGVIIGGAFGNIVKSLTDDILMPVLSLLTGGMDFKDWFLALDGSTYKTLEEAKKAGAATVNYGLFLNAVIAFILMAFAIFWIVKLANRFKKPQEVIVADPGPTKDQVLLMEIRDALRTRS